MKNIPLVLVIMTAIVTGLTGCRSSRVNAPSSSVAEPSTRNNCYSLLYQLLSDEKNVSLLLFIKREENDVNRLIKKIAASSKSGAKQLEELAKKDPRIKLDDFRLPSGEVATRDAIAATKKKDLLGKSGSDFELALLLTQVQALSYGSHLAKVALTHETDPERVRALAGIGAEMEKLYQEVYLLMLSRKK